MTNQNKMDTFIQKARKIVESGGTEQEITKSIASALETLINSDYVLPSEFKVPNKEKYVLYPVYVAPDKSFSIASAVWDVGQAAPVHDHRTWGVIGIVQGTEYEVSYVRPQDDGVQPLKVLNKTYLNEGEVSVCCTTDQDVHEVSCASEIPCVGLHVYGGNIGTITRYMYNVDSGEKKAVVTKWGEIAN